MLLPGARPYVNPGPCRQEASHWEEGEFSASTTHDGPSNIQNALSAALASPGAKPPSY
jgi:hypothetical protein